MSPLPSFNYKLTIAYVGTAYSGWQIQPNGLSIQEVLESSLGKLLRKRPSIHGSGRTDAGVHARGQVAHFHFEEKLDCDSTAFKLNCILPKDISIIALEEVDVSFHARFSAVSKIYHYYIHTSPIPDPFTYGLRTTIRYPLDRDLMKKAAEYFIGTHDFTSFANVSHSGGKQNPNKTIYSIEFVDIPGGFYIAFYGKGFLYKMVRNLTGALLRVGSNNLTLDELSLIMQAKDRRKAPMAAPAHGLFLEKVHYSLS